MALTLREMYETYIQTNHTIQESTKRRCQRAFGPFVALKGNTEADQVSRADVVAYQALLIKGGKSMTTVNSYAAQVSAVFGWFVSLGLLDGNPFTGVRKLRQQSTTRSGRISLRGGPVESALPVPPFCLQSCRRRRGSAGCGEGIVIAHGLPSMTFPEPGGESGPPTRLLISLPSSASLLPSPFRENPMKRIAQTLWSMFVALVCPAAYRGRCGVR